jgi:hypothetical protein
MLIIAISAKDAGMVGRLPFSSSLRSCLLYVVLVGLPLAGVSGALYLGERLEAPASVSGNWRLEVEGSAPCRSSLGEALSVVQSGPALQLAFTGAAPLTLAGRVDGLRVTASEASGALALEATLDQSRGASRLQGTLTASACAGPVHWLATRLPATE